MLEINWEFVLAENKGSVDTCEDMALAWRFKRIYRVQTPSGVFTKKVTVIIRLTV